MRHQHGSNPRDTGYAGVRTCSADADAPSEIVSPLTWHPMRKLISSAVLAVICAAGAPSAADAQSRSAIPELAVPHAVAPPHAPLGAAAEVRQELFSAAARETFRAERRSPLLLPAVGALVGAAGVGGLFAYKCSGSGECIFNPVAPLVAGAVLGAAVGGIVELGLRVAGR